MNNRFSSFRYIYNAILIRGVFRSKGVLFFQIGLNSLPLLILSLIFFKPPKEILAVDAETLVDVCLLVLCMFESLSSMQKVKAPNPLFPHYIAVFPLSFLELVIYRLGLILCDLRYVVYGLPLIVFSLRALWFGDLLLTFLTIIVFLFGYVNMSMVHLMIFDFLRIMSPKKRASSSSLVAVLLTLWLLAVPLHLSALGIVKHVPILGFLREGLLFLLEGNARYASYSVLKQFLCTTVLGAVVALTGLGEKSSKTNLL